MPTLCTVLNAFNLGTFSMTLSTITGKYSYTYAGTALNVAFQLEDPSTLGHQMGFNEVSYSAFVQRIGDSFSSLVSANVLDFVGTSTLFLHSDMVSDSSSILQELYSDNSVPFSNLVYNCSNPGMYTKKMSKTSSSIFNFAVQDEHDREVRLNGHDICVTLLLYRKEDLTKLFKTVFAK